VNIVTVEEDLIKKYQRTQSLTKRRPILSSIVKQSGRDKAAAVCKLEDVDWLHWYYWDHTKEMTEISSRLILENKESKERKEGNGASYRTNMKGKMGN
jgi:hypothetical protein